MDAEQEKRFRFRARFEAEQAKGSSGYVPPLSPEQQAENIQKAKQDAVKSLPILDRVLGGVGKGLMDTYAGVAQLATKATDAAGLTNDASGRVTRAYGAEREAYNEGTKGDIASRVGEVGGNVALAALVPTGGAAGLTGKLGTKLGGKLGSVLASALGRASVGSALEGAALGATQFAGEGESRLNNAVLGGVTGGAIPMAGKVLKEGTKAVGAFANKTLGKAAQELSGVSEEALRKYGTGLGQGAKDIRAAAGTQHDIGQKLVTMLDKLDDYLPEKDIVDKALQAMPDVNVANTLQTLKAAQTGGVLKSSRDVNEKIVGLIDDLTKAADPNGNIPAATFREIRKELDQLAGDAFGKESNKFVTAVKEARHTMADDLVQAAEASGNPEYTQAMRSMAEKIRAADNLKQFLGKSAQTREARAESFVSTLFGKNKEERQKAVEAMGQIFGDDFLHQSKLAHLAAELGDGGKPSLLPRQFTGRSALGPGLSGLLYATGAAPASAIPMALSSPKIASMALGAADALGTGAKTLAQKSRPLATRLLPLASRVGAMEASRP